MSAQHNKAARLYLNFSLVCVCANAWLSNYTGKRSWPCVTVSLVFGTHAHMHLNFRISKVFLLTVTGMQI